MGYAENELGVINCHRCLAAHICNSKKSLFHPDAIGGFPVLPMTSCLDIVSLWVALFADNFNDHKQKPNLYIIVLHLFLKKLVAETNVKTSLCRFNLS